MSYLIGTCGVRRMDRECNARVYNKSGMPSKVWGGEAIAVD